MNALVACEESQAVTRERENKENMLGNGAKRGKRPRKETRKNISGSCKGNGRTMDKY